MSTKIFYATSTTPSYSCGHSVKCQTAWKPAAAFCWFQRHVSHVMNTELTSSHSGNSWARASQDTTRNLFYQCDNLVLCMCCKPADWFELTINVSDFCLVENSSSTYLCPFSKSGLKKATFLTRRTHDRCTSRRVRDLWWQGIPPSVRGRVWSLAVGNDLNITHGTSHCGFQLQMHKQTVLCKYTGHSIGVPSKLAEWWVSVSISQKRQPESTPSKPSWFFF